MLTQKMNVKGNDLTTYQMRMPYVLEAAYILHLEQMLDKAKASPEGRDTRSGKVHGLWDLDLECDLGAGAFPLLHGKKVAGKPLRGELAAFLHGATNAADFRAFGCDFWDQNANETQGWLANPNRKGVDDLGRIYGAQWMGWKDHKGDPVNQMNDLVQGLICQPYERAHIVSAWNVGEMALMALRPCHVMFQCYVTDEGQLNLKMYQRSADWFLGVPFNLASYGLLLLWLCQKTGLDPGKLKITFGDAHLYDNHIEAAKTYLKQWESLNSQRDRLDPFLVTVQANRADRGDIFVEPPDANHFKISGYRSMPAVPAPMAP